MENTVEIWKPVVGYEGLYECSNMGRVKSLDRIDCRNHFIKGKIISLNKRKGEYLSVSLCKNGKIKTVSVHRIVAQAFIPNPNNLPMINHKDENPSNNCVDNLEWCDAKYNMNWGNINIKRAESLGYGKDNPFSIPILQFDKNGNFIKEWASTMDVQRELHIQHSNIIKCCKKKKNNKSAGGYKWGYAVDYERIPFKIFDLEIYRKKVG